MSEERTAGGRWKPIVLIALLLGLLVISPSLGLDERLESLQAWIGGLGPLGPVVFVLIYIVAVVAALPGSAITVVAGALFGSVWGVIVVSIGSTLGAGLAFLAGRFFARRAVEGWLSEKEMFRKLDGMTEEHGAIMVALTRLVPLFPFNLLNYGFGLTRVPFWTYLFWSWLCMLPGTVLYVVGADAIATGIREGRVPWPLVGALLVVFVLLIVIVRRAKGRLKMKESA